MVMDSYDLMVKIYDKTLDIYIDDNEAKIHELIENIIKISESVETNSDNRSEQDKINNNTKKEIYETIMTLKESLKILQTRRIANIGGKVLHYIYNSVNNKYQEKWFLIQVWYKYR